jgi:hypothetical protein
VSADDCGVVSQAGALLLVEALRVTGLGRGLSAALSRWRSPWAVHDPGKIAADLMVALALGGDYLADIPVVRSEPQLFGPVASDPVVFWLIKALAADAPRALNAIRAARAGARQRAWELAGDAAPGAGGGRVRLARAQLPCHQRRRVLIRTDSGGGTHEFLAWLTHPARRLAYSVGMTLTEDMQDAILKVPSRAWTPAYDAEGQARPGAWVAEITGMLNLTFPGQRGRFGTKGPKVQSGQPWPGERRACARADDSSRSGQ